MNKIKQNFFFDFLLVFFTSYTVYLLTLYPTVGTEDSGELIVAAAKLDIAHPPGYPLHTLLGKLFTILIPFGNIGWRVNILSAFFAAATIGILYLLLRKLTKNSILAMAGSLFFAFTDIFWSQALRTEVYSLHSFFLVLLIWLLLLWDEHGKTFYLYMGAFLCGLSLTNHHLMFLAGPPIIFFVLSKNWRLIKKPHLVIGCLLLFTLGLSIYLYLPLRSSLAPYNNPAYIKHPALNTFEEFFSFVNRKIYGGSVNLEISTQENIDHLLQIGINNIFGLYSFFKRSFGQLFFLPLFFLIPGLYHLLKKHQKFGVFIVLLLFFYSSVQLVFTPMSEQMHLSSLFSLRPFLISGTILLWIISIMGISLMLEKLTKHFTHSTIQTISTLFLVLPLLALLTNFSANNESTNYVAYDFNRNLLESLPANAFLVSIGKDNLTFPLYYLQEIDHIRPDIKLEIYYGKKSPDQKYFQKKQLENPGKPIFIDLLPSNYFDLNIIPYNFVFLYGQDADLPPTNLEHFALRGIRPHMDYPNSKLKGFYYLKLALHYAATDPAKTTFYFAKIKEEIPEIDLFTKFIQDYKGGLGKNGMF